MSCGSREGRDGALMSVRRGRGFGEGGAAPPGRPGARRGGWRGMGGGGARRGSGRDSEKDAENNNNGNDNDTEDAYGEDGKIRVIVTATTNKLAAWEKGGTAPQPKRCGRA